MSEGTDKRPEEEGVFGSEAIEEEPAWDGVKDKGKDRLCESLAVGAGRRDRYLRSTQPPREGLSGTPGVPSQD